MIALYCKQGSADEKIYIDVACNGNIVNGLMNAAIIVTLFFSDLHFFIFSILCHPWSTSEFYRLSIELAVYKDINVVIFVKHFKIGTQKML